MTTVTDRPRTLHVASKHDAGGGVLVQVEDSGPGIEPDDVDRVFKAFYTTKAKGMGMGLSISRSIVEAHHGRLWASPGTRIGAVFHLVLPPASGLIHSGDSQKARSSSSSGYESRNCRQRHPSRPPSP
jgi:signal transduction histidine kinase